MTELSIVIVSWNARRDLERCLTSLYGCTSGIAFEVIVVDNASSDDTVGALRRRFPVVAIIENTENLGFARGCNQGMAAASGEFVLLLNADTYVADNVIGRSVATLRKRPEIGMLGCRLCFPDGRIQHTANRSLSIRRSLLERLWLYKLLPPRRRSVLLLDGYWPHDHEMEVDWLAGAFLLLRRSLYTESGGFDERFWMYGEDSEWCMRLRRMGHRILFTPAPGTVFHTGSVSSDLLWTEKERLRRCHIGGIEAYRASHGSALAAGYRAAELLGCTVRFVMYWLAHRARGGGYYAAQASLFRWLVEFYAAPGPRLSADRANR